MLAVNSPRNWQLKFADEGFEMRSSSYENFGAYRSLNSSRRTAGVAELAYETDGGRPTAVPQNNPLSCGGVQNL